MTAVTNLADLAQLFADGEPDLEVGLVAEKRANEAQDPVQILNLAGDAERYFRDLIDDVVINGRASWALRPLDILYKPEPHEVEWAEIAEVPAVGLAVNRYSNLAPFPQFDPGEERFKSRLRYWVCAATGQGGEKAYFFRRFSRAAELSRKRGAALVVRQGSFHRVEETIFVFDEAIDCLVYGDYLYVIRKNDYRSIFDQFERLRREARTAATALGARVPISNLDAFVEACATQSAMADRIIAVQKSDYFGELDMDQLTPVIDEFALDIQVDEVDGVPTLTFRPEPPHRFEILKLVGDDYLRSAMTNHLYEANSKTERRQE